MASLVFISTTALTAPAFAASRTWTGLGANSSWSTAGNWSANTVPISGDTVTIDVLGKPAVIGSGVTGGAGAITIGSSATGTLTIQAGGVLNGSWAGSIGEVAGSTGAVTVTGGNSTWNLVANTLYVGNSGSGTLTIADGGTVTNGNASIGYNAGSTGTVTVTGGNSKWNLPANTLYVGNSGSGTLTIADGGTVTSRNASIGLNSGSTGTMTVTGNGSTWNIENNIFVGYKDNGTLSIEAGGTVTSGNASIGYNAGSTGTVTVTGTGSTWTTGTGTLYVGYSGSGTRI